MTFVDDVFIATAKQMHDELASTRLEVTLIPAPTPQHEHHMVRAVCSQNPAWYRQLCAMYPKHRSTPRRGRKPDTAIKRAHVLRALNELASGRCETTYAYRLLPFVMRKSGRWIFRPVDVGAIPV